MMLEMHWDARGLHTGKIDSHEIESDACGFAEGGVHNRNLGVPLAEVGQDGAVRVRGPPDGDCFAGQAVPLRDSLLLQRILKGCLYQQHPVSVLRPAGLEGQA
jgi:hypothetical protein